MNANNTMLIYLDLCCFNPPFDDQSHLIVHLQTQAKLFVQEGIRSAQFKLVWSAVLDLENAENPDVERSKAIADWRFLQPMTLMLQNRSKHWQRLLVLSLWMHCT